MIETIIKERKDGILIDIDVQANAKRNEIAGINEWRKRLSVKIKAPAIEGKANKEIIKFFENLFKKDVEIILGKTSSQKTILILGAKKGYVEEILKKELERAK
ncbi:MAG: YggU family protein [Methanococci archaeon]|nr:YggU family protein [Methanococci archaeon]